MFTPPRGVGSAGFSYPADPQGDQESSGAANTSGARSTRQPSGVLANLLQIPEMTQRVALHADRNTVIGMAGTTHDMRAALGPENQAAVFERNASTINTGQAFHGALTRLRPIPENFRDGPLSVLGIRIPRLPQNQQQTALDAWLPLAQQQRNRSSLLDDLVLAGAEGPAGMSRVPELSVERGDNVQVVAQRFGITDPVLLLTLQRRSAFGPASAAVRAGENVQVVAQRLGITDPGILLTLQ